MENNNRIALLIDAENVPVTRMPAVINEMAKYGTAITSRFYADVKAVGDDWRRISSEFAIRPVHQYNVAYGKNAADMAMSLDALEIMNEGLVNMFILVTSDSDFTPLAIRLREKGAIVVGIGDQKASKAFVSSCNEFKYFDYLVEGEKTEEVETDDLETMIRNIIIESGSEGKIHLSYLGTLLTNLQSDFDPRRYGARSLSKLISTLKSFTTERDGERMFVKIVESRESIQVADFILLKVKNSKNKRIGLPEMKKLLEAQFKNFKIENYGFSRFGKFIDSFDGLSIDKNSVVLEGTEEPAK